MILIFAQFAHRTHNAISQPQPPSPSPHHRSTDGRTDGKTIFISNSTNLPLAPSYGILRRGSSKDGCGVERDWLIFVSKGTSTTTVNDAVFEQQPTPLTFPSLVDLQRRESDIITIMIVKIGVCRWLPN